jgi:hypothetical protein
MRMRSARAAADGEAAVGAAAVGDAVELLAEPVGCVPDGGVDAHAVPPSSTAAVSATAVGMLLAPRMRVGVIAER